MAAGQRGQMGGDGVDIVRALDEDETSLLAQAGPQVHDSIGQRRVGHRRALAPDEGRAPTTVGQPGHEADRMIGQALAPGGRAQEGADGARGRGSHEC